jgi:hypothetical protein
MRTLVFPFILAFVLTLGVMGTIGVMAAFPEMATVYPEQAIETAVAPSDARSGHQRADIGTENAVRQ